jgi:type VI secretion system protein ImpF
MVSGEPTELLRPSLLERLLGGGSHQERVGQDLRVGVRELRREVLRDLEFLLNTRALNRADLAGHPLASGSVLGYGVPDLTGASRDSVQDTQRVRSEIEEAVRRYEPRLVADSVRVERIVATDKESKTFEPIFKMRFRIHGLLRVEPEPEPIAFDTEIEMGSGAIELKEV